MWCWMSSAWTGVKDGECYIDGQVRVSELAERAWIIEADDASG